MISMQRFQPVCRLAVLCGVITNLGVGGCSSSTSGSGHETGNVSGVVKLDGQPLEGAKVGFHPDQGPSAYGKTDASGKYEIQLSSEQSGAMLGKNTVRITTASGLRENDQGKIELKVPERIPAQFNVRSELVREVKPGANSFDFDLTSKGEIVQPSSLEGDEG